MKKRREALVAGLLLVAVAACGKSGKGGYTLQDFEKNELVAASAAVPAEWQGEIKLVAKTGEAGDVFYAAPESWKAEDDEHFGPTISPPEGAKAAFLVNYVKLGTSCQGACKSTDDWKPKVDDYLSNRRQGEGVVRDEAVGEDTQVVVSEDEEFHTLTMEVVRWRRGASHMLICSVSMSSSPEAKTLLPVVEQICVTARARDW